MLKLKIQAVSLATLTALSLAATHAQAADPASQNARDFKDNTCKDVMRLSGVDRDVAVVMWGEFGRTPKINNMNSRDHWPRANFALVAGGGMKTGQVIGSTDRIGADVADRPVTFQEVFATLYHKLGIDAHRDRLFDGSGTPRYPVDSEIEPIHELL